MRMPYKISPITDLVFMGNGNVCDFLSRYAILFLIAFVIYIGFSGFVCMSVRVCAGEGC